MDTTTWVTDGVVRALTTVGDVTYLGGSFTSVGVASGNCAVVRTDTGRPISPFPRVEGTVRAALTDGAGGWYIGGDFLSVGSLARRRVAHVLADGTIDEWAPRVGTISTGVVYALARVGNAVVIGGSFGAVNDSVRTRIAAVDATTGELLPFSPTINNIVYALAASGSTVYVGGVFTGNNATSRPYLAAYGLSSNSPLAFAPRAGYLVRALLLHEGTLYAGGDFGVMGDSTRNHVAALDPLTGAVKGWNPNVNGSVWALAATGSNIVIGGTFTQVRGRPRLNIALWDGLADSLSAWSPGVNAWVTSLDATPSSVRVVGQFTTAGGQPRSKAAELDLVSGVPTAWNPSLEGGDAYAVASVEGQILVGGSFYQLYFQPRVGLAAVEASTGTLTDWYPGAVLNGVSAGHINEIVERNGVAYLGGSFTSIGGVSRRHLAAADAASGALLAGWDPQVGHSSTHYVNSISLGGSTLFIGGSFTTVNGSVPRGNFAELRISDGLATTWNPSVDGEVLQVVRQGSTLYLSGNFNMLSGAPRENLGAFDLSSGLTSSWAPQVNGYVHAILPSGGTVYLGGDFSQLGGLPRADLGAVDAVTGLPTSWVASTDGFGSVYALVPHLDGIIAAGAFVNVGGQPRNRAAFLHSDGGVDPDWNPNVGLADVYAISTAPDGGVFLGGGFQTVDGRPHANLARVSPATGLLDAPREFPLPSALELSIAPHPIVSRARLQFALPVAASVTASVFDAAGRRVVALLDRAALRAGAHALDLDTRSLATGCYFIRLETGGRVGTTRLVLSR